LAWRNGEAVVTQNGLPFMLGRRAGDWFGAERGSFEFMLKPGRAGTLKVDIGAGRVPTFEKLGRRKAVPAAIAGAYVSADSGAAWQIERQGESFVAHVRGPLIASGAPWPITGIDADTVDIATPGNWLSVTQLAHLERDRAGKIAALIVSSGRIKNMRFKRME
jgi:D-aminopeptidase